MTVLTKVTNPESEKIALIMSRCRSTVATTTIWRRVDAPNTSSTHQGRTPFKRTTSTGANTWQIRIKPFVSGERGETAGGKLWNIVAEVRRFETIMMWTLLEVSSTEYVGTPRPSLTSPSPGLPQQARRLILSVKSSNLIYLVLSTLQIFSELFRR